MYCHKCGKQIRDDAAFCPFCGEQIRQSDVQNNKVEVLTKSEPNKTGYTIIIWLLVIILSSSIAGWYYNSYIKVPDLDKTYSLDYVIAHQKQFDGKRAYIECYISSIFEQQYFPVPANTTFLVSNKSEVIGESGFITRDFQNNKTNAPSTYWDEIDRVTKGEAIELYLEAYDNGKLYVKPGDRIIISGHIISGKKQSSVGTSWAGINVSYIIIESVQSTSY